MSDTRLLETLVLGIQEKVDHLTNSKVALEKDLLALRESLDNVKEQVENVRRQLKDLDKETAEVAESIKTKLHEVELSIERLKAQTKQAPIQLLNQVTATAEQSQSQEQDQKQMEEKKDGDFNLSFGDGTTVEGDIAKHKGDNVDGDKVTGGQVKADNIEGGVTQTNVVNQNVPTFKEIKDKLSEVEQELVQAVPHAKAEVEDVMALTASYLDDFESNPDAVNTPVPDEDITNLSAKVTTMSEKVGKVASASAPVAIAMIKSLASPPFPLNVVCAGLEAIVG